MSQTVSPDLPARPLSVLVAEDNQINQFLITALLSQWGYRFQVAPNGAEALRALSEHAFDVVLMDIQMPVMDGLSATRKIRTMPPPLCDLPIIAVTANALSSQRDEYLSAGMNDFVPKPIDAERLRAAIASHTGQTAMGAAGSPPDTEPKPDDNLNADQEESLRDLFDAI